MWMEVQVPKVQWVMLGQGVLLVYSVHLVLQDLREALASLELKVQGEMLVFLDSKVKLDLKENRVHQEHKV